MRVNILFFLVTSLAVVSCSEEKAQQKSAIRPTSTAVSLWDLSHQANILSASFRLAREIISCANQLFSALKHRHRDIIVKADGKLRLEK